MAQLFVTVLYKPEGRGFDPRWCHIKLLAALWRMVDSASKRNEYQVYLLVGKGGRDIGLTTLPPLCVDCLEIWETKTPGFIRAYPDLCRDCFVFCFVKN